MEFTERANKSNMQAYNKCVGWLCVLGEIREGMAENIEVSEEVNVALPVVRKW
jgi:hypothetical protein